MHLFQSLNAAILLDLSTSDKEFSTYTTRQSQRSVCRFLSQPCAHTTLHVRKTELNRGTVPIHCPGSNSPTGQGSLASVRHVSWGTWQALLHKTRMAAKPVWAQLVRGRASGPAISCLGCCNSPLWPHGLRDDAKWGRLCWSEPGEGPGPKRENWENSQETERNGHSQLGECV